MIAEDWCMFAATTVAVKRGAGWAHGKGGLGIADWLD
jgi:hypothetical protein